MGGEQRDVDQGVLCRRVSPKSIFRHQSLVINNIYFDDREEKASCRVRLEVRNEPLPKRTQAELPILLLRPLHRAPHLLHDEHWLLFPDAVAPGRGRVMI